MKPAFLAPNVLKGRTSKEREVTYNIKTMVYKACPRCQGDLALDTTAPSPEYICLQCGRSLSASIVVNRTRVPSRPIAA
jgi:hypothetical protein